MAMEDKEKKIGFIIEAIEQHLPMLIRRIVDEFYSPESAGKIGKGLAEYYKALRDGGVPEGAAVELLQSYASNLTFKGMGQMYHPMPPMGMMGMRHMMGKYSKKMWHEGKGECPEEGGES